MRARSAHAGSSDLAVLSTLTSSVQGPVLTPRAVAAGLLVGTVLCFSNTYFGLQTGWVTMGSLQSAILGYGLFQGLSAAGLLTRHLDPAENVIVQTTAVATATMPLAAGLVGIIPALGLLTAEERPQGPLVFNTWQLLAWCTALAFFGVFVAVPLRHQTIVREQLRFPSGAATASVIRTLHGLPAQQDGPQAEDRCAAGLDSTGDSSADVGGDSSAQDGAWTPGQTRKALPAADMEVAVSQTDDPELSSLLGRPSSAEQSAVQQQQQQQQWANALRLLLWTFALSGAYSLAAAWIKPLKAFKIFDWLHIPAATAWGWVLQPSAGYVGQGMIMGPKTAWSMMAGAITGWAVLGPMARAKGWAPGPIKDIETGAAGWLMWLGLALLLGDCFSELALLVASTICDKLGHRGMFSASTSGTWTGSEAAAGRRSPAAKPSGGVWLQRQARGWHKLDQQRLLSAGLRSRSGSRGCGGVPGVEMSPSSSSANVTSREEQAGDLEAGATAVADLASLSGAQGEASQQSLPSQGQGSAAGQSPGEGFDGGSSNSRLHRQQQQQRYWNSSSSSTGPHRQHAPLAAGLHAPDAAAGDSHRWMMSTGFWLPGLLCSTALATAVLSPMLKMPVYEPLVAVLVALLVALLAVRALGQTDLNPVSGVGKISQLVFAVVSPGSVLPNLVAGAIAEAGAQQAGDLMQDFKTAYLLGVPPSSQLVAMLLGSAASIPLSVAAYTLYTSAWQVPGPELPAPTAQIWLDMAKLVNGGRLPEHIGPFCAVAAAIAAALPVLQLVLRWLQQRPQEAPPSDCDAEGTSGLLSSMPALSAGPYLDSKPRSSIWKNAGVRLWRTWRQRRLSDWVLALMPSGVGFAVGCYLTPNWTLPRLIGSIVEQTWLLLSPVSHSAFMMVTASGLVLGEGCASIVTAVVQAVLR